MKKLTTTLVWVIFLTLLVSANTEAQKIQPYDFGGNFGFVKGYSLNYKESEYRLYEISFGGRHYDGIVAFAIGIDFYKSGPFFHWKPRGFKGKITKSGRVSNHFEVTYGLNIGFGQHIKKSSATRGIDGKIIHWQGLDNAGFYAGIGPLIGAGILFGDDNFCGFDIMLSTAICGDPFSLTYHQIESHIQMRFKIFFGKWYK